MSDTAPTAESSQQQNDLVAAFHTSFHFTQGNTLDWSATVDDETYTPILKGVEFSALPSGLHGVERDVVCVLIAVVGTVAMIADGPVTLHLNSIATLQGASMMP